MPADAGDCQEEKTAHGTLGAVKGEETLIRFVLLGDDFVDANNNIKRSVLPMEQFLKENDGWSLQRLEHVADIAAALEKFAAKQNPPKRREEYGYAMVKAADVRAIVDENQQRAICVIDTPEEDNPAHATACKARTYEKHKARKIRNQLLKKFTKVKAS